MIPRKHFAPTLSTALGLALVFLSCGPSADRTDTPERAESGQLAARSADGTRAAGGAAICETQTVSGPDDTCAPYVQEELCQPREFVASNGVLEVELDVAKKWQCVPAGSRTDWKMLPKNIRNYGIEVDGEMVYGFPGPTFRMKRKASKNAPTEGDRFKMLFTNSMGPTTVEQQMECFQKSDDRFIDDKAPNCLHGNETTNFHFHGFHVSPQPLQDYVLLKLYPKDTPGIPNYDPSMTNEELRKLKSIGGAYRYDVDPLPYNQPEGTHWYHAHHHGATAMQVINGMGGTFIVDGPFDKWLNDQYGYGPNGDPNLVDRLMVVQQINDALSTTTPLLNGQGNPLVSVRPGEVQRWRFVAATTQASAQLDVQLAGLEVCQIQMDGIQFSNGNYQRQPLLKGTVIPGSPCRTGASFMLSPGNRVDFLVKMPLETGMQRGEEMEIMMQVVGNVGEEAQGLMSEQRSMALPEGRAKMAAMEPTQLMTLRMMDPVDVEMELPARLPPLPGFLAPPEPTTKKELVYQMYGFQGRNPAPVFKIDGMQVRDCVPEKLTVTRGTDERWIVRNTLDDKPAVEKKAIAHPFHIHTNPFYVVRNGNAEYTTAADEWQHGIWQDTIALPLVSADDKDSDPEKASSVDLFMEFEDYTGGYVQHCHILGHEDRGMMTLVQTLCEDEPKFGTPVADKPDNCGVTREPLPVCAP